MPIVQFSRASYHESAMSTGQKRGDAVVTKRRPNVSKLVQTSALWKCPLPMRQCCIGASFQQAMQTYQKLNETLFHGDNTGSNPVGDAK